MTGGAVFNQALREVRGLGLTSASERDFIAALHACFPGAAGLLYELGHEASLSRGELLARGAGLYCSFAAGSLADDLIDGECDYLSASDRIGPSVQFGLQNLGYAILSRSGAPRDAVAAMAHDLAVAGASEHLEGENWTLERFIRVAHGIAGLQWRAYLAVLWAEADDVDVGELGAALGVALHLAEDIRTKDRRFYDLSGNERGELRRWGLGLASRLHGSGSRCLAAVGASVEQECRRGAHGR